MGVSVPPFNGAEAPELPEMEGVQRGTFRVWGDEQYAQVFAAIGDRGTAIELERRAVLDRGGSPAEVTMEFEVIEHACKHSGTEAYWRQLLQFEARKNGERHLMRMAAICARLNHLDESFRWLDRARKESPNRVAFGIETNPSLDGLRSDPRFAALLKGLWRTN